jgi:hypothetical protein
MAPWPPANDRRLPRFYAFCRVLPPKKLGRATRRFGQARAGRSERQTNFRLFLGQPHF